jgi:iron complex outermembrane receptor protein
MTTRTPLYKKITFVVTLLVAGLAGYGQADTAIKALENLSLEDLLNVKVVSVSKKAELLFDAPLSASVVTREDIRRAGSTSIMEALRLVPGMIIREQSNGNYDIYLRGMDNVPPNGAFEGNSTTTLVMINNRPIYNYLKGGTFWETLPVDLNDVEKIEVIRGPAAALYGPNAVSGVINIITRETKKDGLYLVAGSRQGSNRTNINNASLGYRFNRQWDMIVSGNYQTRNRTQTSYYEFFRNQWLTDPDYMVGFLNDTFYNAQTLHPRPEQAINKYAGNAFVNYRASNKLFLNLAAGAQHSTVQKVSTENGITPLTTVVSDSRYVDLRAQVLGLSAQFSHNKGTQMIDHRPGNEYDFSVFDYNLEYNYTWNNLSVKPGISYRDAIYDDTKYSDTATKIGIFNTRGHITTSSASLRTEYKLWQNKIRLVAGLMVTRFNHPDTTYISYQLAATWKLAKKHLLRAVLSQSPRSPAFYDNYANQFITQTPIGVNKYLLINLEKNQNLQLLTARMFELGYRGAVTKTISIDVELFSIQAKNYNALVLNRSYNKLQGNDTMHVIPIKSTNLPLQVAQQGITVSLTWNTSKIQVKPFVTLQRSRIKNYSPYMSTPDADPFLSSSDPVNQNIYSGIGTTIRAEGTPDVFGGATFNYTPATKWNINLSTYCYTAQTYYHAANVAFNDGVRGIDHINAKCLINANIQYEAVKGLRFSCTAKNILNDNSREFFRSDAVPCMLLGGISYEF